jgi:hypothetical protein
LPVLPHEYFPGGRVGEKKNIELNQRHKKKSAQVIGFDIIAV